DGVVAFSRRQFRNQVETGAALLVELDHLNRGGKERIEPRDVVAHVLDQLVIARRMRAVRLVDQEAAVSGAVEQWRLPPRRRQQQLRNDAEALSGQRSPA